MADDTEPGWVPDLRYLAHARGPVTRRAAAGLALVPVVAVAGLVTGITLGQTVLGVTLVVLGAVALLASGVLGVLVLDRRPTSRWRGDDLLQIAVAPAGVVVQGGLRVRWSEVAGITWTWGAPTSSLRGAAGTGVRLAHRALDVAGVDRTEKNVHVLLSDHPSIRSRARTRPARAVVVGPTLGASGFVLVLLQDRSDQEMRDLLDVLRTYARRQGIAFGPQDGSVPGTPGD